MKDVSLNPVLSIRALSLWQSGREGERVLFNEVADKNTWEIRGCSYFRQPYYNIGALRIKWGYRVMKYSGLREQGPFLVLRCPCPQPVDVRNCGTSRRKPGIPCSPPPPRTLINPEIRNPAASVYAHRTGYAR